ncbi:tail tube protein gp19, partial [Rarobacter faecitabidus]
TVVNWQGQRLRTWQFNDVFAVRWTGPQLNVDSEQMLEESLEIAHHGFKSRTP